MEAGFSAKDAIDEALGGWGKRFIRTSTPPDIDERMGAWLEKYSRVNDELLASGEKALFRYV